MTDARTSNLIGAQVAAQYAAMNAAEIGAEVALLRRAENDLDAVDAKTAFLINLPTVLTLLKHLRARLDAIEADVRKAAAKHGIEPEAEEAQP